MALLLVSTGSLQKLLMVVGLQVFILTVVLIMVLNCGRWCSNCRCGAWRYPSFTNQCLVVPEKGRAEIMVVLDMAVIADLVLEVVRLRFGGGGGFKACSSNGGIGGGSSSYTLGHTGLCAVALTSTSTNIKPFSWCTTGTTIILVR